MQIDSIVATANIVAGLPVHLLSLCILSASGSGRGVARPASLSRLFARADLIHGVCIGWTEQSIRALRYRVISLIIVLPFLLALFLLLAGHAKGNRQGGTKGRGSRRFGRHESK